MRIHARSLDEAIVRLLQFYRSRLLDEYFGIDKGKLSSLPRRIGLKTEIYDSVVD